MRHARQQTDITATAPRRVWDSVKNKPQKGAKKWAKPKKPGILKKRNMATTLSNKFAIGQGDNPQVEMDSEITRLREEIEQERQMK